MKITLQTKTPIWTGGVDGKVDRLHETGLIGSLRWWYEALVRGLGGYACDPTSDVPNGRCQFDTKAYKKAKKDGKTETDAINAGLHSVCPVCYVFGTTGWARLFQLRSLKVPTTPLHFRTTLPMNKSWLKKVFGGENQNINSLQVPYGELQFQFIPRRLDAEYAWSQFALILHFAAKHGGIGARNQHGFGQFTFPAELEHISFAEGLRQLTARMRKNILRSGGPRVDPPFDLKNFVSLTYEIPKHTLSDFLTPTAHIGSGQKKQEERYVPCAFDLRYKGAAKWGLRKCLKEQGWKETTDPKKLEELDLLMGPRSQWGRGRNQRQIDDKFRTASRVFFGMPYQKDENTYILRIRAFWVPELRHRLPDTKALQTLLNAYVQQVFGNQAKITYEATGNDVLNRPLGDTR